MSVCEILKYRLKKSAVVEVDSTVVSGILFTCFPTGDCIPTIYGDFQLIPEVVRLPLFEVPYPQLKRGQQSLGALVAVVRLFRYIYVTDETVTSWLRIVSH